MTKKKSSAMKDFWEILIGRRRSPTIEQLVETYARATMLLWAIEIELKKIDKLHDLCQKLNNKVKHLNKSSH